MTQPLFWGYGEEMLLPVASNLPKKKNSFFKFMNMKLNVTLVIVWFLVLTVIFFTGIKLVSLKRRI
jgi:hypothetical protein